MTWLGVPVEHWAGIAASVVVFIFLVAVASASMSRPSDFLASPAQPMSGDGKPLHEVRHWHPADPAGLPDTLVSADAAAGH